MRLAAACLVAGLAGMAGCQESEPAEPTWRDVQDVFAAHGCSDGTCHSQTSMAGGLNLEANAYDNLVDAPCANGTADGDGYLRVAPDDPRMSFLLHKLEIQIVEPGFGMPMPPAGDPLDEGELAIVERWIESGAVR